MLQYVLKKKIYIDFIIIIILCFMKKKFFW